MRGDNEQQAGMYSYISPEQRVPADHPLRPLRQMTDEIFKQLSQSAGILAHGSLLPVPGLSLAPNESIEQRGRTGYDRHRRSGNRSQRVF